MNKPSSDPIGLGVRDANKDQWSLDHSHDALATARTFMQLATHRQMCCIELTAEQYECYQAVATLVFAKDLIPEATLPALVKFLLVGVSEAVTEHIDEIIDKLCAVFKDVGGEENV